jgi:hypothetical protein
MLLYWYKSTCCAGTKVQILTQKSVPSLSAQRFCTSPPLSLYFDSGIKVQPPQFTCSTGTKVPAQILHSSLAGAGFR